MNENEIEKKVEEIMDTVDDEGGSDNMTQSEWKAFLEGLKYEVSSRLGAVSAELEEED